MRATPEQLKLRGVLSALPYGASAPAIPDALDLDMATVTEWLADFAIVLNRYSRIAQQDEDELRSVRQGLAGVGRLIRMAMKEPGAP